MALFPQFGKQPSGKRLARIQQSPNYQHNRFQNLDFTPNISEEFSFPKLLKSYLSPVATEPIPVKGVPFEKHNLHHLSDNSLDYLIISHDHYDHLDYKTVVALQPKVGQVVCGLGVGEHLEYWGYNPQQINELDWHQQVQLNHGVRIRATPARHFSGRGFSRNNTLFCSYVLSSAQQKIFIGGDSGYGSHFNEIGEQYGPFDFGVLECGQYNVMWKEIHTLPHEWTKVISELRLKSVMPVHFGKFKLALHDWNEPIKRFTEEIAQLTIPSFTPVIGSILHWDKSPLHNQWWE